MKNTDATSDPQAETRGIGIADICIHRPVFATMINLFLVVLGWFSFRGIGVDQFPNVELPVVTVTTTLRGASPEEMETSVTKPLEEIINTVQGIDELNSITTEGVSQITIQFLLERNRDIAAQDVRDKVNTILSRLPPGTDAPIIDKFDLDSMPVMTISASGPRDLKEITYITDKFIKQNLETVSDVGSISMAGARTRAVQVSVDPDKLRAYQLTIADVQHALERQNVEVPGGRLNQPGREVVVRTLGRMAAVKDFNELIVANFGGQPVYLRDVAKVEDGVEEPRSLSRANGENCVTLTVRKQSGSNTVKVIEGVTERMEELKKTLPSDIKLQIVRDQSRFIKRSLEEINFHLLLGAVLVAITTFFFMHDWRGTVIAAVAIPSSIIATFVLMRVMNYTLNNFTMLGLVFAVGIVIDDAIVVLENIHRTMEEKGWDGKRAASFATREIALAVMATTLSLVVIFLPLAFMEGRVGMFFSSYGVTVAFAIMVSLFVSFTLTPMLSARFLKHSTNERVREKKAHGGPLMKSLSHLYIGTLGWSLRHRWVIMLAAFACIAALPTLGKLTKFTFIPQDDSSEFEISMQMPEGSDLARTQQIAEGIADKLRALRIDGQPVITDTLMTLGNTTGRLGKGEGDVTIASVYCRLPETGGWWSKMMGETRSWSQFQVMGMARKIMTNYPDVRSSVQLISNISSGGRNSDLMFNLTGPDLAKLGKYADEIIQKLSQLPGLADVDSTLSNRKPELRVDIDREKASQFGLQVQDIADTLRTLVGGVIVGTFRENDDLYDVWLRADAGSRSTQQALEDMTVRTGGEHSTLVQLASFVHFREGQGPSEINRFQRQRKITIQANLAGKALGDAIKDVEVIAQAMNMAPGYNVVFTGRAKTLQETAENFFIAFGLAMIFMYMILAAQFENFVHPIAILLAVPLSLPFALGTMIALNEPLNIYAIFGIFMLFGIVKKNGILQVDYANTLRARGMERDEAILQANRTRLRPILMTTLMLVASMIPIALGQGPGSAGRASMAKVIIGGQMLCLLLTLLVTPVAYAIFDDWSHGRFWNRKRKNVAAPAPEPLPQAEPAAV
ncbi:efflux RND transporter permease subunit [Prosthecobacter sp.]|uniref:efflux RND transporter permease subunit n=1 Tax=Prosthecobacter sp. TaxID=1965333 RepID=UPI001DB3ECCA|nr:efflux RND transporter permease subunit [Prosthecobacter sp.]MCB1277776.1 efflux RND transporter permease subunit [Prosthecobacter sp.]